MAIKFLASATSEFSDLESGVARPYFYVEAIISGITSVVGQSYITSNWLLVGLDLKMYQEQHFYYKEGLFCWRHYALIRDKMSLIFD